MVEALFDGYRIAYSSIVIHESTSLYTCEVKLSTATVIPLRSRVKIKMKNTLEFVVMGVYYNNVDYTYTLYPELYCNILNTVFPEMVFEGTTTEFLNALGVEVSENSIDTHFTKWVVPSLKWKNLAKVVEDYTIPVNGAGTYLNVGLDGKVRVADFKSAYSSKDYSLATGNVDLYEASIEWMFDVPGHIKERFYTEEGGLFKDNIIKDGYGCGSYTKVIQDEFVGLEENALLNDFYKKYYRSVKMSLSRCSMATAPFLGSKYSLRGGKNFYLLDEYYIQYNQGTEPVLKINLIAPADE